MTHARIRLEPLGGTSSVVIVDEDGTEHDITSAVSECETLRNQHGDCIAILTLPRVYVEARARAVVDRTTRDALLALGWTPPQLTKQRVSELFEQETGTPSAGLTRDEMLTELRQRGVATGGSEV